MRSSRWSGSGSDSRRRRRGPVAPRAMSGRAPALDDFFGSVTNTLLDELGGDANDACWSGELGRRVEDGLVEVLIRFAETKMQEADSGGASSSVSYNPGRKSGSDPTCRLKSFGQCICVGQAYLKAVESGASPDDALQTVRSRFNRNFSPDTVINYSNVARVMRARGITVKTANYATKSGQVFVWPQVGEMLGIDTRQYRDRQEIIAAIADLAARADKDNSKRTS